MEIRPYLLPLLAAFPLLFWQCEKAFISTPDTTNEAVFEEMWTTVDEKYSFFEYKNLDWDSVRTVYEPLAIAAQNDEELFDVLANMLFTLRDGHVNLRSSFDRSRNWRWFLDHPANFEWNIIERNYFEGDQYQVSGPFRHRLIDSVGYVYYSSFSSSLVPTNLDYVLEKYESAKGLILDVRDNGGGRLSYARLLASRLLDKTRVVYSEVYSNGPEHSDFSTPDVESLSPSSNAYTKPVVILTNRSCYSATNFFAAMMKGLPHVTIIGDKTGGGGGTPADFELPNGWTYRISVTQTYDRNGLNIEHGVDPDISLQMDSTDIQNGIDTYIEYAKSHIMNQ